MVWYVSRRLLAIVLLLLVTSFAVFSLLYLTPGSIVEVLLGPRPESPQVLQQLRHEYHLDQPFLVQYWLWLQDAARFRFGNSVQTTLPVSDEIKARLPTSIFLGVYAYVLTMIAGVGLGCLAALRRRSVMDRGVVGAAIIGLSLPAFVSGLLLIYFLGIVVPLFPVFGKGSGFFDELWHLTLPAAALAIGLSAYVLKHTRAAMLGVLDQDYVVFARARGLSAPRILLMYVFRNALIPVVTISGVILATLIVGAVLVEVTFSVQGLGQLLVQSASVKDVPMLQGVTMVVAAMIMLANLLADLIYMAVDPRIRLGRRSA